MLQDFLQLGFLGEAVCPSGLASVLRCQLLAWVMRLTHRGKKGDEDERAGQVREAGVCRMMGIGGRGFVNFHLSVCVCGGVIFRLLPRDRESFPFSFVFYFFFFFCFF